MIKLYVTSDTSETKRYASAADHIHISFLKDRVLPEAMIRAQQSGPCQRAGAGQLKQLLLTPEFSVGGQRQLSSHALIFGALWIFSKKLFIPFPILYPATKSGEVPEIRQIFG